MSPTSPTMAIAAGGTGGHLIPALAIAAALGRARPGARVVFIGGRRGMEGEMIPRAGYPLATTSVRPFGGGTRALAAAGSLLPATMQARRVLRRERVAAVLGMGGYPSVPVVAAARLAGIPSLVHEQNAVAGLANEMAARLTPNIAVSFPATRAAFGRREPRVVGLPVREEIARVDLPARRPEALAAFGLEEARRTVLIFGGSLGARRLNAAVLELASRWRDRDDVQLVLATGRAHHEEVVAGMPDGTLITRVEPSIERMDLAYAVADVVVARAGASTVFELAAVGRPSVLVPYPHARRREQHANARLLVDAGAAEVIEDAALGDRLAPAVERILDDDTGRARMAAAALTVARPGAADEMAAWLLALAEGDDG